jgi:hypothetical protein
LLKATAYSVKSPASMPTSEYPSVVALADSVRAAPACVKLVAWTPDQRVDS